MASSSNITTRPSLRSFKSSVDGKMMLVNMAFVRAITQQNDTTLRLLFGPGDDYLDVIRVNFDELRDTP
jgi:hypothetical protein